MSDTLTSQTRPKTSATLTVRIIKSFTYRTEKSLVLHDVNLIEMTVGQLKERARQGASLLLSLFHPPLMDSLAAVQTQPGWKPYKNVHLDTMKLYTKAHGAKTQNLIINLDHDEWILSDENATLDGLGFENETEVSFFNRADYDTFQKNPETGWAC